MKEPNCCTTMTVIIDDASAFKLSSSNPSFAKEDNDSKVPEMVPASDVSSASDTTKSTAPLTPDHSHTSHRKVLSSLSLDEFEFRSKLDLLCEEIRRSASMDDAEFRAATEQLADEPATPPSERVLLLVETIPAGAIESPRIPGLPPLPRASPAATATATSTAATTSHRKKRVSWGSLEVRKYPIIPGQHPDCVVGPPITVDWECCKVALGSIDSFESKRKPRRRADELRLTWLERRRVLRRLGFQDQDMYRAQLESERVRKQRERTASRIHLAKIEEVQQSVLRKLGRTLYPKKVLLTKY